MLSVTHQSFIKQLCDYFLEDEMRLELLEALLNNAPLEGIDQVLFKSLTKCGLALYTKDGLRLTKEGRVFANGVAGYPKFKKSGGLQEAKIGLSLFANRTFDCYLDLGCGFGFPTMEVCKEVVIKQTIGIDLELLAVLLAYHFASLEPEGFSDTKIYFVNAKSEKLPFTDNSFDLITAIRSLPYMNPFVTLQEVSRVMKPGALGLLQLHSPGLFIVQLKKELRRYNLRSVAYNSIGVLNSFFLNAVRLPFKILIHDGVPSGQNKQGFMRLLRACGLELLEWFDGKDRSRPVAVFHKRRSVRQHVR